MPAGEPEPAVLPEPTARPELPARQVAALRRRELGGFLRSRRERISPERVGLPSAGRRRTPGLRREEVAQLAGVGVSWYTWLEQGRDINVSEQVLEAISRTLLLDRHESAHLFSLAGRGLQPSERDASCIPAATLAVLDKLSPYPAAVSNGRFDILAHNRTWGRLLVDLDGLAEGERNSLWLAFTHPVWRTGLVDWEETTGRMVAQFRAGMAEHVAEPAWKCMLKRLQAASPDFRRMWDRHEVLIPENKTKRYRSPGAGWLTFDYSNHWLDRVGDLRLVTYVPADDTTRDALSRLL